MSDRWGALDRVGRAPDPCMQDVWDRDSQSSRQPRLGGCHTAASPSALAGMICSFILESFPQRALTGCRRSVELVYLPIRNMATGFLLKFAAPSMIVRRSPEGGKPVRRVASGKNHLGPEAFA